MASGLFAAGWPVLLQWEVIARPLPDPLRRTVGAVISGRLKAAAAMPVPGSDAGTAAVPHQAPGPDRTAPGQGGAGRTARRPPRPRGPTWNSSRSNSGAASTGTPSATPTTASARPSPSSARPSAPNTSAGPSACREDARYARLDTALPVAETDDGTCPGHNAPCGEGEDIPFDLGRDRGL
ncbi:hypothetical protein [Streptomyces sp. Tue 6075]|uniref:hypothetical protein n=1 Tax=Streptomyces sp. Tue 6075 TaxID=1661694 RepID=UPI000AD17F34|nr:hypothetical protein [Streptomyces sp. Tue 6075]